MKIRGFATAAGAFLMTLGLAASAHAQTGPAVPSQFLYTYYDTTNPFVPAEVTTAFNPDETFNEGGQGDNIIRLINPNGAANTGLAGASSQPVCAMIYVFDDDEEMGECCGCPLTSAQLATYSVEKNLISNWGLGGGPEGGFHGQGAIEIVAASENVPISFVPGLSNGQGCASADLACNGGCDPTNLPGYEVTTENNLFGSITHNQVVAGTSSIIQVSGITETEINEDCHGNAANLAYVQSQCGALVGNGSRGGVCNCPSE